MLKSVAKIFSSHIVVKALGLLNVIIILSFFSVEEFGKYSYLLVLLHLVGVIIDPFLSAYFVDFKTYNYKKYNFGVLVLSLVFSFIFYFIIYSLNNELTFSLFALFYFTFMIGTGLKSFLNAKEKYFNYGLVDVIRQLSIFVSTLLYFYLFSSENYIFLLELNYALSLISIIILFVVFVHKNEIHFDFRFLTLKTLTLNSKFLILHIAILPFVAFIDSYFVEKYLTGQDLGLYSFSLKVYSISLLLFAPILTVLNVKQIEIAKEKSYLLFLKKNLKKVFVLSTILLIVVVIINLVITQYVYLDYKNSFLDTSILLLAAYVSYISMPFSFLIAYRKYKQLFFLGISGIGINILINFLFIEKYGTTTAAFSTFFAQLVINFGSAILSYILLKRNHEV
tara:strand:+ start:3647 stop:4831 length:1185 start_codon:yes stop_codon:yes gene_type:complete